MYSGSLRAIRCTAFWVPCASILGLLIGRERTQKTTQDCVHATMQTGQRETVHLNYKSDCTVHPILIRV